MTNDVETLDPRQVSSDTTLARPRRQLVLTILYHPDFGRVGERSWLPPVASAAPAAVSRQTPIRVGCGDGQLGDGEECDDGDLNFAGDYGPGCSRL